MGDVLAAVLRGERITSRFDAAAVACRPVGGGPSRFRDRAREAYTDLSDAVTKHLIPPDGAALVIAVAPLFGLTNYMKLPPYALYWHSSSLLCCQYFQAGLEVCQSRGMPTSSLARPLG
jgi:hypothetical protein